METHEIRVKVIAVLDNIAKVEYKHIFSEEIEDDARLQLLTSESMLALLFVTSIEDEFGVQFKDDEINMEFFASINDLCARVEKSLRKVSVS